MFINSVTGSSIRPKFNKQKSGTSSILTDNFSGTSSVIQDGSQSVGRAQQEWAGFRKWAEFSASRLGSGTGDPWRSCRCEGACGIVRSLERRVLGRSYKNVSLVKISYIKLPTDNNFNT